MDAQFFEKKFDNAIWDFNKSMGKRLASDVGSKVYKMLAIATEPFFRREMGERHFSAASSKNGFLLWLLSTIASCFTGTLMAPALSSVRLDKLAQLFQGPWFPLLIGALVILIYWVFSSENQNQLRRYREDGKTYHSKSRGQPRCSDPAQELGIRIGASVLLLLLVPVAGVAFIASMYVCSSLAAQQEAALYDRYLDALDAQIEGELLQDALLGKCPPEITFIYKPLPNNMKPELRENIAAAAVGKPVKIVAQAPRPATSEREQEPVAQS